MRTARTKRSVGAAVLGVGAAVWLAGAGVLVSLGGAFIAASSGEPGASHQIIATGPPLASEVEADLTQPGRLAICSSFPRVRFAEMDADGMPFGMDIDLGLELALRLGLEADVRDLPFEALIDAVVGRECDISVAGQFITEGRLEVIDMIPYREGTAHVIVRAGSEPDIDELVDLCGRSMAVVSGTIHLEIVLGVGDYEGRGIDDQCRSADQPAVDLREYSSQAEAEDALARGDVDAYSGNDFVTVDRPDDFALAVELLPIQNGIGLRKDAPSLEAGIRAALGSMISDRTYLSILERYDVVHVAVSAAP